MDPKELRGLVEAYSEVYAPQEEIDEAVKGEPSERRADLAAERREGHRPLPAKEGEKYAKYKMAQISHAKRKGMDEEVEQVDEKIIVTRGTSTNAAGQKIPWTHSHNTATGRSSVKDKFGERDATDRNPKLDRASDKIKSDTMSRKKGTRYEQVDIFDVVLEFLQVEGYAETLEEAEWLMANVIDEEAIGIILGEAQEARNNPEKYEAGENKKYAPVRGEKRPMPPRGNPDREAFEKWYAANVR